MIEALQLWAMAICTVGRQYVVSFLPYTLGGLRAITRFKPRASSRAAVHFVGPACNNPGPSTLFRLPSTHRFLHNALQLSTIDLSFLSALSKLPPRDERQSRARDFGGRRELRLTCEGENLDLEDQATSDRRRKTVKG